MEKLVLEGKLNKRFENEPLEKRLLKIGMCEFPRTFARMLAKYSPERSTYLIRCKGSFNAKDKGRFSLW